MLIATRFGDGYKYTYIGGKILQLGGTTLQIYYCAISAKCRVLWLYTLLVTLQACVGPLSAVVEWIFKQKLTDMGMCLAITCSISSRIAIIYIYMIRQIFVYTRYYAEYISNSWIYSTMYTKLVSRYSLCLAQDWRLLHPSAELVHNTG